MSKPQATHRFLKQRIGEIQKVTMFRMSDGMKVATAAGDIVVYGEDPNRMTGSRQFLDHSYALTFMRKLADRDLAVELGVKPEDVRFNNVIAVIEEQFVDKTIITPGDLVGSRAQ